MSGLLGAVLPAVYSASNKLKRSVNTLLSDPREWLERQAQTVSTDARNARNLLSEAVNEDLAGQAQGRGLLSYGPANQRAANALADAYNVGGMTVFPQAAALETARKNAVKMLGLPEGNTPMDRARAMGFVDDGLLHGGTNDFPAFKVSDRSNVYATDVPAIADIYANATGRHKALREVNANPNVMPLMHRGKLLEVSDQGPTGGGWLQDNLAEAIGTTPRRNLVKEVPAKGYSGVKVTDMDDLGGRQSQYVFPDPAVLRSRFAAFDPARVNENDLLGRADLNLLGLLGIGAGGAAYMTRDRRE